ncbi:hypothetical protein BDF22DRAFT_746227 [Syncephalis plumigaleata]|nr:hypothetical protein BDF22DRAFT_746227 [Syncephalis plumigaleata]
MSNQSGIQVSKELAERFAQAIADPCDRVIRVSIKNESLVEDGIRAVEKDWETDFSLIDAFLEDRIPAYILYRLDSKNMAGDYEWLFLCYDELTLKGYKEHLRHLKAAAPLTEEEERMARLQISEAETGIGTGSRRTHVAGVAFPVEEAAQDALQRLVSSDHQDNCVILQLNVKGETIELDKAQTVAVSELANAIPNDVPRFTFYSYKKDDDDDKEVIIFIYTCPSSSNIRERMLYSSVRGALLNTVKDMGITVEKKMETDDVTELTAQELSSLFPVEKSTTAGMRPNAFKKPPLPGRGRPRTIKRPVQQE